MGRSDGVITSNAVGRVSFGLYEANLQTGELRKSGVRVRIQGQPFKVLAVLLERPNVIVTREELLERLWGRDTTVDFDHGLATAINKLREALGDSADNPTFIETLARRGYRFIAPVRVEEVGESGAVEAAPALQATLPVATGLSAASGLITQSALPAAPGPPLAIPTQPRVVSLWLLAFLAALVCIAALAWVLVQTREPRPPSRISQLTFSGRVLPSLADIESLSSIASDGNRLYFAQVANGVPILSIALIADGEISTLTLPSGIESPVIGSISPDGSKLVVLNHVAPDSEQAVWSVPTLGGNARRVPDVLAHDATWMPDGQHILYAAGNDLSIVKEDGSDRQRFAAVGGRAFWLRWSPDGQTLRFSIVDASSRSVSLWQINAAGRDLHPLLPGWPKPANECCGSWTADGERYVFQSSHNGSSNIWEMDRPVWWRPGRREPHLVTNGPLDFSAPATDRQGPQIYFIGANSRWDVRMFSAASGQFVPLASSLSSASLVEYSHDGLWVAWLNAADGSLWRSRADGSERLQLMTPPFHVFVMRWSPDDSRLAVMAQRSGSPWKLYLVDAAGGDVQPVLHENRDEADPSWADADTLIFGRVPSAMGGDAARAIYKVNLQSRHVDEVPGSRGLFSPRVSPDAHYIAAVRTDQRALMLYDRTAGPTARWTLLAQHGVGDPVWSHDSRAVFFQDFLEPGKPVYRAEVPRGTLARVASLENVRAADVLDYRLIGLTPGEMPLVTAQTSVVNLYALRLDNR